jgi:OOP family OmpA-OmpF porin
MKQALSIAVLFLAFAFLSTEASGQVKINLKKKLNKQADTRANKNTDKAVDKSFDKMEDGIKGIFKKKDDKASDGNKNADDSTVGNAENQANENNQTAGGKGNKNNPLSLTWNKFDFVPGDKIIYEDNLISEENGEFPSRWDLYDGTVENAVFGGENVIMFRGGSPSIVPYLKNPKIDYLPDVFTIEFDLYLPSNSFTVYFFDKKNQATQKGHNYLNIIGEEMSLHPASSKIPEGKSIRKTWAHIAIAYTNGKMKCYINETRLINIPHLDFNPTGVSLYASTANDNNLFYIKNFRIAEGGVKYYDRFLQDGKIVSNGIRFDVGRATLRPESMGVLNEIYMMLNDHPDISVSIEGHTDSDGDFDLNQKLSEDRAKTVMNQLISMGINASKVSFRGFGESKPVATNDTPEGKASNRRVEFVRSN